VEVIDLLKVGRRLDERCLFFKNKC